MQQENIIIIIEVNAIKEIVKKNRALKRFYFCGVESRRLLYCTLVALIPRRIHS